jgi:hypothetical protein
MRTALNFLQRTGVVFCAALIWPSLALGQTDAASQTASCELHVWPAQDLRSMYLGFWRNGLPDAAARGDRGYVPLPARSLDTAKQLEQLKTLNLVALLNLPDHTTIYHDTPLDSRTLRTTPGRITSSTAPCYAEFALDEVFFEAIWGGGGSLKVLARFRQFGSPQMPTRVFGTIIKRPLKIFPPRSVEQDPTAGLNELAAAFDAEIAEFGVALNKPPKTQRKPS